MAKFVCKVRSNYGSRGEVVEIKGLDAEALTDRQKNLLKPHEEQVKVLEVATPKQPAKAGK